MFSRREPPRPSPSPGGGRKGERLEHLRHRVVVDGRRRVAIASVRPEIDAGRFPVKRILDDKLQVSCDLLVDGHDKIAGCVLYRHESDAEFFEAPLAPRPNDRYVAELPLDKLGRWMFTVESWLDDWSTFTWGLQRKVDAAVDVHLELAAGISLVKSAAARARELAPDDAAALDTALAAMADELRDQAERAAAALSPSLAQIMARHPDREFATRHPRLVEVVVDPPRARFSSWYELFPRSCGDDGKHGTFADVEKRLSYVRDLGFDVVYLPPIHPIGATFRKGKNNSLNAGADDVGSPWAIGAAEGGHTAIHPALGTVEDFRRLVATAKKMDIEIALDIAFQASPDHPWVKAHPEWFTQRADGSIQYAENPPKKYQDVYPFKFDGEHWRELYAELKSVFEYWIAQGITIFRVDNPHTKPLPFWEWCIGELKAAHPEVLFLAEAFTRPAMMRQLAKLGFSQSYTYFTWRTNKRELMEYARELTETELREYFRPNFWPNTPDILPEHLQWGGRAAFLQRLVLASTLSSNWGIYGPAFELMEHVARPGAEEYADNEKYQLRNWSLDNPDSLAPVIKRINRARRENRALQDNRNLVFHATDNDSVIAYSKRSDDGNAVLVIVNLDAAHAHSAWIDLDGKALGVAGDDAFQVHDVIGEARYQWRPGKSFVMLDPSVMPAHVFAVHLKSKRENDFEYYL
jgi:starch synthase (maltosyl-transferring)